MKSFTYSIPVVLVLILSACGGKEDEDVVLLPSRVETTVVGAQTEKIIADFYYVEGSNLIDRIAWSNAQTHYFDYNADGTISQVGKLKAAERMQEELRFEYNGDQLDKVSIVVKNLDADYLEPIDSVTVGYLLYGYTDGRITAELYYSNDKGITRLESSRQFEYDEKGNVLRTTHINEVTDEVEKTEEFTYDSRKHPYSELSYYFTGDSHVNNMLTRKPSDEIVEYSYELEINEQGYPEMIYERIGNNNTRITTYSYLIP